MKIVRRILIWVLVVFFIVAGANHFRTPAIYYGMMPTWITSPVTVNVASGLAAVKDRGGIALVQDPDDALHASMPSSARDHVDVDHVLPAAELGRLVGALVTHSPGDSDPPLSASIETFQADERAHRDAAIEAGAESSIGYPILYAAIRAGCRAAIELSKRI